MRNAPKLRCTSYPQFFCCQREKDLRSKDSSGKPWTEEASQTGKQLYALAFAFSLTPVSVSSTEYATFSQWYCLRICSWLPPVCCRGVLPAHVHHYRRCGE